jgi:hypothetical protein
MTAEYSPFSPEQQRDHAAEAVEAADAIKSTLCDVSNALDDLYNRIRGI